MSARPQTNVGFHGITLYWILATNILLRVQLQNISVSEVAAQPSRAGFGFAGSSAKAKLGRVYAHGRIMRTYSNIFSSFCSRQVCLWFCSSRTSSNTRSTMSCTCPENIHTRRLQKKKCFRSMHVHAMHLHSHAAICTYDAEPQPSNLKTPLGTNATLS